MTRWRRRRRRRGPPPPSCFPDYFSILSPTSSECIQGNCNYEVTWDISPIDTIPYISLVYVVDGVTYSITDIPNTGSYYWSLDGLCSQQVTLYLEAGAAASNVIDIHIYRLGDFNGDCIVDNDDLSGITCMINYQCYPKPECCGGGLCSEVAIDFDCDGQFTMSDYAFLIDCIYNGSGCNNCCQ